jgi:hypothetical protein
VDLIQGQFIEILALVQVQISETTTYPAMPSVYWNHATPHQTRISFSLNDLQLKIAPPLPYVPRPLSKAPG